MREWDMIDYVYRERKEERLALVTKLKNISTQHTHTHILRSKHQPSCIFSCTYLLVSMLSCYILLFKTDVQSPLAS